MHVQRLRTKLGDRGRLDRDGARRRLSLPPNRRPRPRTRHRRPRAAASEARHAAVREHRIARGCRGHRLDHRDRCPAAPSSGSRKSHESWSAKRGCSRRSRRPIRAAGPSSRRLRARGSAARVTLIDPEGHVRGDTEFDRASLAQLPEPSRPARGARGARFGERRGPERAAERVDQRAAAVRGGSGRAGRASPSHAFRRHWRAWTRRFTPSSARSRPRGS